MHQIGHSRATVRLKSRGYRNQVPDRSLRSYGKRSVVAVRIWPQLYGFVRSIWKGQVKRVLLVDSRPDRPYLGIASEDAQKVSLISIANIAV
ncbi:MAG: hypothetical protein QOJ42_6038 [Acidobacteriaceae bacterium]|nr:hypothetical protein [Acidobacteriaceae bacterium]